MSLLRKGVGFAAGRVCVWGEYHCGGELFVCVQRLSGVWGLCVGHEGTKKPKGTLADSELRNKRICAHREIDRIVRAGCMSRDGVYVWLSGRLNLPYEETHIGYFSDYLCEETDRECEKVMENWNGNRRGRAA